MIVDKADAEGMIVRGFDAYEVLAVTPTIEKGKAYRVNIVVGKEIPSTLFCDTSIFSLHRSEN